MSLGSNPQIHFCLKLPFHNYTSYRKLELQTRLSPTLSLSFPPSPSLTRPFFFLFPFRFPFGKELGILKIRFDARCCLISVAQCFHLCHIPFLEKALFSSAPCFTVAAAPLSRLQAVTSRALPF